MSKRRFILVDEDAGEETVSTRALQSEDFDAGRLLASILLGGGAVPQVTGRLYLTEAEGGLYILGPKGSRANFIVFDLESAPIFDNVSVKDAILRFQKVLRFARRRFAHASPAQNEKMFSNSTKAVVFPYPINTQSSIRISLELSPDSHRRERRAKGIEILAYRIGKDEGGGLREEPPVTVFRRAVEGLPDASSTVSRLAKERDSELVQGLRSMAVTSLASGVISGTIVGCNFDEWQQFLSEPQKEFVRQPLTSPHLLEGPAGTGKTLSLVLKCISQLRDAATAGREHKALFVAHSEATRRSIESMFEPERSSDSLSLQSVKVTTLQELCSELLRYEVAEVELLDRDAFESKQSQLLYSVESLQQVMEDDYQSHRPHMSKDFADFLAGSDQWATAEMFQHEISVMIKGRADEDLERYKRLPSLKYGLPIRNDGDKAFSFLLFNAYQDRLKTTNQFDTDDVVLTALGQLDTPIWRRRREREAYDTIFVDETHLFNLNELSIFHRLTRTTSYFPIAFSIDVSQSLGDRGWKDVELDQALVSTDLVARADKKQSTFTSIFRCSPDIVSLAFSVTSSGATLFTNFEDPLVGATSAFTAIEESKAATPEYLFYPSDAAMVSSAFDVADRFVTQMGVTRGDVALVVFGNSLFAEVETFAREHNKHVELLKHRGDMELVQRARASGRHILATPDFVGGLQFDAVVLIGVDKGRVPPGFAKDSVDSDNFASYATHQRLYVSITRARFRVAILGMKARGASDILRSAIAGGYLLVEE